jgi:hypothetical protein
MKLIGDNGNEFSLRILNYQYPDENVDKWDSNWLHIETETSIDGRTWRSVEPCLLTWEVAWLYQWLENITQGDNTNLEVSFLEPNLLFRCLGTSDNKIRIRVYFELGSRPIWAVSNECGLEDLWVEIICSKEEILEAAQDLRNQRSIYIPRAGIGLSRDKGV